MFLLSRLSRIAMTSLVAAFIVFGNGCSDKRITNANVNEVTDGMAKKQVESILGQPTSIETKDPLSKMTTYIYRQGKESVTIVFKDDKVQTKQSTLSE